MTEAVISVPAYFNDDKRCATKNAGKLAGLTVKRLINEPSAVALKHHMGVKNAEVFIIFDFGEGTLVYLLWTLLIIWWRFRRYQEIIIWAVKISMKL